MSEDILLKFIEKHENDLVELKKENAVQNEQLKNIEEKLDMLLKAFNIGEGIVNSTKIFGKIIAFVAGIVSAAYGLYTIINDYLYK